MSKNDSLDDTSKILLTLEGYELGLINQGIDSKRINFKNHLAGAAKVEILKHARYLITEAKKQKKVKEGCDPILNQKLGAIQTCLSFAGFYSILDTMYDNRNK